MPCTKQVSISVTGKHSKSVQTKSISKAPGKIDNQQTIFQKQKVFEFPVTSQKDKKSGIANIIM